GPVLAWPELREAAPGSGQPQGAGHLGSSSTSTQRRSCHEVSPSSASCTPRAPALRSHGNGSSQTTCLRKRSHCTLNAFARVSLVGTLVHPSRKSMGLGTSGFQTGFGVVARGWTTT